MNSCSIQLFLFLICSSTNIDVSLFRHMNEAQKVDYLNTNSWIMFWKTNNIYRVNWRYKNEFLLIFHLDYSHFGRKALRNVTVLRNKKKLTHAAFVALSSHLRRDEMMTPAILRSSLPSSISNQTIAEKYRRLNLACANRNIHSDPVFVRLLNRHDRWYSAAIFDVVRQCRRTTMRRREFDHRETVRHRC